MVGRQHRDTCRRGGTLRLPGRAGCSSNCPTCSQESHATCASLGEAVPGWCKDRWRGCVTCNGAISDLACKRCYVQFLQRAVGHNDVVHLSMLSSSSGDQRTRRITTG